MTIYCLDTSAILDGWIRHYPPGVFPSVHAHVEHLVVTGRILLSDEVLRELAKKDDVAHKWAKAQKAAHVPLDEDIQDATARILARFPRLLDTRKNRSAADPFVIATAQVRGAMVITGEAPTNNLAKPNIPDVCRTFGILCGRFLDVLQNEGWRY